MRALGTGLSKNILKLENYIHRRFVNMHFTSQIEIDLRNRNNIFHESEPTKINC